MRIPLLIVLFAFYSIFSRAQEFEIVTDANAHQLLWSSYTGITGSDMTEHIVSDINGNIYTTGFIVSTDQSNWPFLNSFNGGTQDAYLNKTNRDGTILWSLLIGSIGDDFGSAVALTSDGNIMVGGNTNSTDNFIINNSESTYGGGLNDAFIMEITPDGLPLWCRYIGGNGSDYINDIHVGLDEEILICGKTASSAMPYPSNIQPSFGGGLNDGFIGALDTDGNLEWYSYIGGIQDDEITAISSDANGQVFFCGYGSLIPAIGDISPNAPGGGFADALVASVNAAGNVLWARYEGGVGFDTNSGIDITESGNIVVCGSTDSGDILEFGAVNEPQSGDQSAFIISYTSSGVMLWGEYQNGSGQETASDIHVDLFGNIYLTGYTNSTNLTVNEAFQLINRGGYDNFISKWNEDGQMLWSSYSGGTNNDYCNHLSSDRFGKIYIAGHSSSPDMDNILPGHEYNNSNDGFTLKISDCNNPNVSIHSLEDTVFCYGGEAPLVACGANHYNWINGDTTVLTSIDTTMMAYVIGFDTLGCFAMSNLVSILAKEIPEILVDTVGPILVCGEGLIVMAAMGADSISWNNGFEGAEIATDSSFTYVAIGIGENGCAGRSEPIEIQFVELPTVEMAISMDTMCVSDPPIPVIALPQGGMYSGPGTTTFGMFDPLAAGGGTHSLYYTWMDEHGCFGVSDSVVVTVMYYPTVLFASEDTMCVFDSSIPLTGSPIGGIFEGDGVTGATFTPQLSGTGPQNIIYSYVDENGCTNVASHIIYVEACTDIENNIDVAGQISIFPNPANNSTTIQINDHEYYCCDIYSSSGKLMKSISSNSRTIINTEDLPSGIYIMQIVGNSKTTTNQIVIQH